MTGIRSRILSGEIVRGTFLKTPAPQIAELLGLAGLDFAVADMEHAPIGIDALDGLSLAARSVGLPLLIRSTSARADAIWPALDLGCAGVMVPHIRDATDAQSIATAVKYGHGARGFSPSGRAGGYGTVNAADYRRRMDADTVIMAQIEDRCALDELDAIANVPDIDLLFVGPVDLALSLDCTKDAPAMSEALNAVVRAAKRAGKASGIFVKSASEIPHMVAKGFTVFVCGSDQSLLMGAVGAVMVLDVTEN